MRRAIEEIQDFGIEVDIWKIEGVDARADAEMLAEQTRAGEGREGVVCVAARPRRQRRRRSTSGCARRRRSTASSASRSAARSGGTRSGASSTARSRATTRRRRSPTTTCASSRSTSSRKSARASLPARPVRERRHRARGSAPGARARAREPARARRSIRRSHRGARTLQRLCAVIAPAHAQFAGAALRAPAARLRSAHDVAARTALDRPAGRRRPRARRRAAARRLAGRLGGGGPELRAGGSASARVERVVDGDTIAVTSRGRDERVRYIGIDTPETVKPNAPVECWRRGRERAQRDSSCARARR